MLIFPSNHKSINSHEKHPSNLQHSKSAAPPNTKSAAQNINQQHIK